MIDNTEIYEWLRVAASDSKASGILFEQKCYPQALFYLQQSVEKANKAIGLWGQFLRPQDLKNAGHLHDKIHTKALDQQEHSINEMKDLNIDFIGLFSEHLSGERVDMEEYKESIVKLKNIKATLEFAKVQDLELEQLESHVSELELLPGFMQAEIANLNLQEDYTSLSTALADSLFSNINAEEYPDPDDINKNEFIQVINQQMNRGTRATIKLQPSFLQLHLLGFFTSEFAFTRYPDAATGFNPESFFNEKTPVIVLFPRLQKIASHNIRKLTLVARISKTFDLLDFEEDQAEADL